MIYPTDPTVMFKQWTDMQEMAMQNGLKSMEMLQKRTERMVDQIMDQTLWATEKVSNVMMDWGNAYKTGYENLQKVMVPACAMPQASEPPETEPAGE